MSSLTVDPSTPEETAALIREHLAELDAEIEIERAPDKRARLEGLKDKWQQRLADAERLRTP